LETLPLLVKAGAFIPYVPAMTTTEQYRSDNLEVHYYADASVPQAHSEIYEDDGTNPNRVKRDNVDLLHLNATHTDANLQFNLSRSGKGYPTMPKRRATTLVIHNASDAYKQVIINGQPTAIVRVNCTQLPALACYDPNKHQLQIQLLWGNEELKVDVN
jgi:oligosaccharide 4-alpha-D-glucosyltransferase